MSPEAIPTMTAQLAGMPTVRDLRSQEDQRKHFGDLRRLIQQAKRMLGVWTPMELMAFQEPEVREPRDPGLVEAEAKAGLAQERVKKFDIAMRRLTVERKTVEKILSRYGDQVIFNQVNPHAMPKPVQDAAARLKKIDQALLQAAELKQQTHERFVIPANARLNRVARAVDSAAVAASTGAPPLARAEFDELAAELGLSV